MRVRARVKPWFFVLLAALSLGVAGRAATNDGDAPVARAAEERDGARLRALIAQGADVNAPGPDGTTALHWAVHWNDAEMARLLVGAGADVDAANRYGATPLWLAAERSAAAGASRPGRDLSPGGDERPGRDDLLGLLLDAGADPNAPALGAGESPLMAAARGGGAGAVALLLAHGADPDARDGWRHQTALMMAAGNHEPHPHVVRILLAHGADVHARSRSAAEAPFAGGGMRAVGGMTALHFAARQNDAASVRMLLGAGARVDERAPGGITPLRMAIDHGYHDLVDLLLAGGADPDGADDAGFTPLHAALRKRAGGNPERGDRSGGTGGGRSTALLEDLLARGSDPNARLPRKRLPPNFNPDGYPQVNNVQYAGATPFWIAAHLADLEALRILEAAGADPLAASMENTTALMVAAGLGYATRGPTTRLGGRREDTEPAVLAVLEQLVAWGHDVNAVNDNGQTALHGAVAAADPAVVQFLADRGARLDQQDAIGRTPLVMAEEHTTDKYRTNQALNTADVETTYALLRGLEASRERQARDVPQRETTSAPRRLQGEASAAPESGAASEWPGWGGPRRNFTSDAVGLAETWPEDGPTELWRRPLGGGHSSILVDAGRLFTQYRPPAGPEPDTGREEPDAWREEEVVVALDAATGRTLWEHRYPASLDGLDVPLGVGPHATPLVVGERLFATGTNKQLFALDKATGDVLWSHDLVRDFGAPPHYRVMPRTPGYSCSLLAYGDLIIATAGGPGQSVMAFRQDDGRVVWRSGDFAIAPASPILITVEGSEQVVVFASESVEGLDPATGARLWSHPHPRRFDANISTPVWSDDDNLLFLSSAHDGGTRVVEVTGSGVRELWFTMAMRVYYGTAMRIGDLYYGSSGDVGTAFLTAIDANSGEIAWRDRTFARSTLLHADGKLIILDEDGVLGLATVSRRGLRVLAQAPVLTTTAWTVPTLAGTKLYLRDRADIVALDLAAP
ncbi:MAG: ankyrin repeat domain-containing protein [Acidobacteria bacterium]|nr:ankyrin repeat domain-containing protein [Acidobacteriota bacterium]